MFTTHVARPLSNGEPSEQTASFGIIGGPAAASTPRDLVEAATANTLANILDPNTLGDSPLTEQGLQNLVASVSDDLSDAFLDAAQIITADFGIAEFTDFSVEATLFDTLDYSDVPPIEVNPMVLQLYS